MQVRIAAMTSAPGRLLETKAMRRLRELLDGEAELAVPADAARTAAAGRFVLLAVLCLLTALYVYAATIDLGFSADGAYFFMRLLDDKAILVPEPSRLFGSLIQQWPALLAIKAGISSLPLLKYLFHLGLFLPLPISFLICWYASRSLHNDALLLFPLASHLLVSLPAASILAGQSEVLAVIVWPILFLLLRPRLTSVDSLLLLGLLLAMTRMYESAAAPAGIFLCLLIVRFLVDRHTPRLVLVAAAGLAILAPVLAVYWTLANFTAESRGEFVGALSVPVLRHPTLHPMLAFSGCSLLLLVASVLVKRLRWWSWLAALLAAVSILLPVFGRTAGAGVSFAMRSLTFTLLPLLICLAILWRYRNPPFPRWAWLAAGLVMSLLIVGYGTSWSAWSAFRRSFIAELQTHSGYVLIDDTSIAANPQRWSWTPAVLSVLWSGDCVKTIFWNQANPEWPVGLHTRLPLQAYVTYDLPFAAAAAGAVNCR
jgi:hypothetical protein